MNCKTYDGYNLYYEFQGNLNSPHTLVFLNGLTQSTVSWYFVVQHFKSDYRILLMDFIFQGQSDKDSEWRDFDQHARDLKHILDQEKINKPIIAGLSYGSVVAQHYAVLFPHDLSHLILLSTFAHKTPYFDAIGLAWHRALETGGYGLMLDVMLPNVLSEEYFENPIIPIDMMKEARKGMNENTTALMKLMRATNERADYRPTLKKISVPTLILHGEKDLLIPVSMAEQVHQHISNSTFVVIKNAGHTLNLEYVPEVSEHLLQFLRKH